jgi:hypothetical protein
MLAAIALRTSVDIAAELLGIDPEQSFKSKLNELVTGGHIGKVDQSRLDILVEAGNASAHRGWRPKAEDLNVMMDVLEHFVHDTFVAPEQKRQLDAKIEKLEKVPTRQSKTSAQTTIAGYDTASIER